MVANSAISDPLDSDLIDTGRKHGTCANFCVPVGIMLAKIKKLNSILMRILNFFFCLSAYGFGVSLSFILWKMSRKKKKADSYWITPEEEEENYERQF